VRARPFVFAGAGVLVIGLAFLVGRPRVPDPVSNPYAGKRGASRAKAAGLQVYYRRGEAREQAVAPATVLRAGDQLRFVVRGEGPLHVEVRVRDGDQPPATAFPAGAGETKVAAPGETLPGAVTVTAGGSRVVVTGMFSDHARPVGAPADGETQAITIAIAKE
jgi:hypothetical protein